MHLLSGPEHFTLCISIVVNFGKRVMPGPLPIYSYGSPLLNHRPSCCVVNTVISLLFRQGRIPYLSKTAETKPTFQENLPVNSFRFDVSTHPPATLYASTHKPTARQLVQDRREPALNGNTCTLPIRNQPKKNIFWKTIRPDSKKMLFFGFP